MLDGMHCPYCQHEDTKVTNTRPSDDGHVIRRRRECPACGRRFTTIENTMLLVVKRSGMVEPFSRQKVIDGVRQACQGRSVDEEALRLIGQQVEEELQAGGQAEVPSEEIGRAILGPLKDLDVVAYLRFASVYQHFNGLEDFERAIHELRNQE